MVPVVGGALQNRNSKFGRAELSVFSIADCFLNKCYCFRFSTLYSDRVEVTFLRTEDLVLQEVASLFDE